MVTKMLVLTPHGPAHAQKSTEAEENQGLHGAVWWVCVALESRSWSSQLLLTCSASLPQSGVNIYCSPPLVSDQTHTIASSSDWLENQISMPPLPLVMRAHHKHPRTSGTAWRNSVTRALNYTATKYFWHPIAHAVHAYRL